MSGQVKTRRVSFKSIMNTKAFMDGFKDAKAGKPFLIKTKAVEEWSYERGRHFYHYCASIGKPDLAVKEARYTQKPVVTYEAIRIMTQAWREKAIV